MDSNLTLARTTIGDLLFEDRITQASYPMELSNITLSIPSYQRPYTWRSKHALQLLEDIVQAMHANIEVYRVGTLILHRNESVYDIVDGQQRIITFALLLELLSKGSKCEVRFLDQAISDDPANTNNILGNHSAMARRVEVLSEEERTSVLGYIKGHCEFIVFITSDLAESFQFFDSQNARGKKLYPHDLLKAYHLREMADLDETETEAVVRTWEDMDQAWLARLFNEYLYRLLRWEQGECAYTLSEDNISLFKGVTKKHDHPYARFYKGAYAYAEGLNASAIPFVLGLNEVRPFQLTAPIIAGKPFFDYAKCYFDMLRDIQENDQYASTYVRGNEIIAMLDKPEHRDGTGNQITRALFDTALLLYIDRFCSKNQTLEEKEQLNQVIELIFVWAYSLRAQYQRLGWSSAQNYILGTSEKRNTLNLYKMIAQAYSPTDLLNELRRRLRPLPKEIVQYRALHDLLEKPSGEGEPCLIRFREQWIQETQ